MFSVWYIVIIVTVYLFSIGTHFYHEFWIWLHDFINIRNINGWSLHCCNPHLRFWSCIKSPNSKENRYKNRAMVLKGLTRHICFFMFRQRMWPWLAIVVDFMTQTILYYTYLLPIPHHAAAVPPPPLTTLLSLTAAAVLSPPPLLTRVEGDDNPDAIFAVYSDPSADGSRLGSFILNTHSYESWWVLPKGGSSWLLPAWLPPHTTTTTTIIHALFPTLT